MINNTKQLSLFPDMELNNYNFVSKYRLLRLDDASFNMDLSVPTAEDNPEALALERLGYFLVPEVPLSL